MVEISCTDKSLFKRLPRVEFNKVADMLKVAAEKWAAGTMTKTAYDDLVMMTGFRFNPHGVLLSARLRRHIFVPEVVTYDWVHAALQGGALNAEVEGMMLHCSIGRDEVHAFLEDPTWMYPHRGAVKASSLWRIFDVRRISKQEPSKVKASCSELLGVYGLLRFFFELKLGASVEHQDKLRSFSGMCSIVDLLLEAKRGLRRPAEAADELDRLMQLHLGMHLAAYGDAYLKPKNHWLMDVPDQLRRDGVILDAFVIERMHLAVKAVAEPVKNTKSFEQSVMSSLLTKTLSSDREGDFGDGLLGRTQRLPGLGVDILLGDAMRVLGVDLFVDDVVLRGQAAGFVRACALEGGELFFFVAPLQEEPRITEHCSVGRLMPELAVWPAAQVCHALAWRHRADGTVLVLLR